MTVRMTASVKVEERNTWSHGYLEQAGGQDACAKATLAMLFISFYYHGVAARDRTISPKSQIAQAVDGERLGPGSSYLAR